jgi:hypothetical protein
MQDKGASGFVLHAVVVFDKLAVEISTRVHMDDWTRVFLPPQALDLGGWGG